MFVNIRNIIRLFPFFCLFVIMGFVSIVFVRSSLKLQNSKAQLRDSILYSKLTLRGGDASSHNQGIDSQKLSSKLYVPKCEVPRMKNILKFFEHVRTLEFSCSMKALMGENVKFPDAAKTICFDNRFKIVPNNCLVLSFGINDQWQFDDAMDEYGCQVYAFDPTMGVGDFHRSSRIHFFNVGLSNFKGVKRIGDYVAQVDRYENILKRLGLLNKQIDILKIDIEGSELEFLSDVLLTSPQLLTNVRQIAMEVHPGFAPIKISNVELRLSKFTALWNSMHELKCYGFKLAHFRMNENPPQIYKYYDRTETWCFEMLWVRTSF